MHDLQVRRLILSRPQCISFGTGTEVPVRSTPPIEPSSLVTQSRVSGRIVYVIGSSVRYREWRNDPNDLAPVCCSSAGERSRTTCHP